MTQHIQHTTLKELVASGAVRHIEARATPGGWVVEVRYGMSTKMLTTQRGQPRCFKKIDTLIRYLQEIGITRFEVNANAF